MDLDGDMDIITGEMEKSDDPDEITVFLNGGNGLRWDETIKIHAPIYSGKVGDIGNDGDQDIIGNANFNKPPLELWENLIRGDQ